MGTNEEVIISNVELKALMTFFNCNTIARKDRYSDDSN